MPMGGYYGNSFPIRQKKNSVDRTQMEGNLPESENINANVPQEEDTDNKQQ